MEAQRRTDLPHPLAGLTVVELAEDPGGEFSGALLAEMGARVIKVEPPGGAPTRQVGTFANGEAGPETSLNFWYYNSNKRSVTDRPRWSRNPGAAAGPARPSRHLPLHPAAQGA